MELKSETKGCVQIWDKDLCTKPFELCRCTTVD